MPSKRKRPGRWSGNAATIAGLAFSNAFVGLNHSLAHAVGARFGIAHGRANAIFRPHSGSPTFWWATHIRSIVGSNGRASTNRAMCG